MNGGVTPAQVVDLIYGWNPRALELQDSAAPLYLDQTTESIHFITALMALIEEIDTGLLAPESAGPFVAAKATCRASLDAWLAGRSLPLRGADGRARSNPVMVLRRILDAAVSQTRSWSPIGGGRLFISHAVTDRAVAELVARELTARVPAVTTFIASRPGDIPPGEWFETVKAELRAAGAYLVLLSHRSIVRPWVAFEAGAGWHSRRRVFTCTVGGLTKSTVPPPFSHFQILDLENADEAAVFFGELGGGHDGT